MKKLIMGFLAILFGISVASQTLTKEDYLRKSKTQKAWAWVLTGGGAASVIGGIIISGSNTSYFPSETVGPIMIAAGGAAVIGGIILFSASKRNENKAKESTVYLLKMENTTYYTCMGAKNYYFPVLSLRIWIN